MRRPPLIYLVWIALSALIGATVALVVSHSQGKVPPFNIAAIETVITAAGYAFGTFFVILAIEAYSTVAQIRRSDHEVDLLVGEIKAASAAVAADRAASEEHVRASERRVSQIAEDIGGAADQFHQLVIAYLQSLPDGSRRSASAKKTVIRHAMCARHRFIVQHERADPQLVLTAILELQAFMDVASIPVLRARLALEADQRIRQACDAALVALNRPPFDVEAQSADK